MAKWIKQLRTYLLARLLWVAVPLLLLSVLCGLQDQHYIFELMVHFKWLYFWVALILLGVALWLRHRVVMMLSLLTLIANLVSLIPWYQSTQNTAAQGAPVITLLHSNVLSRNHETARLLQLIRQQQPDLVVAQEVTPEWKQALQTLSDQYPYQHIVARADNFGMAVLSRYPLYQMQTRELAQTEYPTLSWQLRIESRELHIIATHPLPPITPDFYQLRNQQLQQIAAQAAALTDVIVVGDLNVTLWSSAYQVLEQQGGLTNCRQGQGILPTWPAWLPVLPLDHCLVSDSLRVQQMRTLERMGSDHLPLLAQITWSTQGL